VNCNNLCQDGREDKRKTKFKILLMFNLKKDKWYKAHTMIKIKILMNQKIIQIKKKLIFLINN
jgi:hypothetical protein